MAALYHATSLIFATKPKTETTPQSFAPVGRAVKQKYPGFEPLSDEAAGRVFYEKRWRDWAQHTVLVTYRGTSPWARKWPTWLLPWPPWSHIIPDQRRYYAGCSLADACDERLA